MSSAIEPFAFFLAVLGSIWLLWSVLPLACGLLMLWVITSWILHKQTPASLGLSATAFRQCAYQWRLMLMLQTLVVMLTTRQDLFSTRTLRSAALYFLWCLVQQTIYQSLIFGRLRVLFREDTRAAIASGLLFSLVHLPNPVLAPATLAWGVCSSLLFARCPSVIALAVEQVLLSAIGVAILPASLHHGFRIGPAY